MIYAMERNNTMPKMFGNVHPFYGVPRPAMWFNLLRVVHFPVLLPRLEFARGGDFGRNRDFVPDRPDQPDGAAPRGDGPRPSAA